MTSTKPPRTELSAALSRIVGAGHVLDSDEDREEYAFDAFPPSRAEEALRGPSPRPEVIVRPGATAEVQAVVRLANESRTAIVPYGGGTGVMGAAVPVKAGIVLDLRRLDRLIWAGRDGLMAEVQAGALLGDVDAALARDGLMLGHDPWSQGIATVGGAISTNGAGYLAAGYGTMGEQVLALEVVLPSGELMATKRVSSAAGPWLHPMFIGSEGTLGIITAATLRVFPTPERRSIRAFDFPDFASGFQAIVEMGRRGVRPAMIDYSEEPATNPGHSMLYLALDGFPADVEAREKVAVSICGSLGGRDLGREEAQGFWDGRHAAADAWKARNAQGRRFGRTLQWGGRGGWFDYLHLALPAERVLELKERCEGMLAEAGLVCREYAIWGRPDLFSVVTGAPEDREIDPEAASQVSERLIAMAQDLGGSMEYCHGVGLKLRSKLARDLAGGMAALRAVKHALDPNSIMNPGKLL